MLGIVLLKTTDETTIVSSVVIAVLMPLGKGIGLSV